MTAQFRVFIANSPQDYVRMFKVQCGSCMVTSHNGFGDKSFWRHMERKHNIHPASWYHFQPYARGVWLELDQVPVARCMQYDMALDGSWDEFGDFKFVKKQYAQVLFQFLQQRMKGRFRNSLVPTRTTYTVPGFDSGDPIEGIVCPLAHCDNQEKDFSVTYDRETDEFTFWPDAIAPDEALKIKATYDHDGFLRASEVLYGSRAILKAIWSTRR